MHIASRSPARHRSENATTVTDPPASHQALPVTPVPVLSSSLVPPPSPIIAAVLERGVIERFYLYPENGPARRVERWQPPLIQNEAELRAVEARSEQLEAALAPAERTELLARVLALLSHYRLDPHPAPVEMRIADDWAEDLAIYPLWAINEAARRWRRSRKFKPQICEMIELCDQAAGDLLRERDRLRQIANRGKAARNPVVRKVETLARGLLQRVPADNAD